MKIGMIKAKNPAPESKINSNAVLKGIGIGLAAAVAITAATTAAVKWLPPRAEKKTNSAAFGC